MDDGSSLAQIDPGRIVFLDRTSRGEQGELFSLRGEVSRESSKKMGKLVSSYRIIASMKIDRKGWWCVFTFLHQI